MQVKLSRLQASFVDAQPDEPHLAKRLAKLPPDALCEVLLQREALLRAAIYDLARHVGFQPIEEQDTGSNEDTKTDAPNRAHAFRRFVKTWIGGAS